MEHSAQSAIDSIGTGFGAIWALAITYSFSVLGAIALIIIGYIVAGLIQRGIHAALGQVPGFDLTLRQFFSNVARYAVLLLVLVMVLGQFGVQTASIIAAIGAIGLAVGLALQGTLQNIAAGIMLLVLRPFRVGESIEVGSSISGQIEDVGLFATQLRQPDGTFVLSPNSKLWTEAVKNSTRNGVKRNDITFFIAYNNDIDFVNKTLVALAKADKRVKQQPAPISFVSAIAEGSLSVSLRYWTSDKDFLRAKIELGEQGLKEIRQKGIRFPSGAGIDPATDEERETEEDLDNAAVAKSKASQPTRQ
jgi:small conductance mechanosensitive channel